MSTGQEAHTHSTILSHLSMAVVSRCTRLTSQRAAGAQRYPCFVPFKGASSTPKKQQATVATAGFEGCSTTLERPVKVVGMGSCVVDYLASVAVFPRPDEKLRSETLEVQGGGNCANALTAAARLGLSPTIVTKIGGDGLGDGIISELRAEGVDTTHLMRAAGHPSPFTYIIVDKAGGTRTCIHTPGAPMIPEDIAGPTAAPGLLDTILSDAALVYFDGRLTEAAMLLAKRAREKGVPVLVEAERLRPGLEQLLALADYVVTSAHYPQESTGESDVMDAVLEIARRLPAARFIITTLGTRGCVMLCREPAATTGAGAGETGRSLRGVVSELEAELEAGGGASVTAQGVTAFDCVSRTGVGIKAGRVASTSAAMALTFSEGRSVEAAKMQARAAAMHAAERDANTKSSASYIAVATADAQNSETVAARVLRATAATLPKDAVVDTTGAGDSFIGSVVYGLATGMSYERMLQLAGVVAACKCTELGARPGLPRRTQLAGSLLQG